MDTFRSNTYLRSSPSMVTALTWLLSEMGLLSGWLLSVGRENFPIVEVRAMDQPIEERTGHSKPVSPTSQLLLTAEQAAATLAICRTKVYDLLRKGELESVQIGTSRRIPYEALTEYVRRLRSDRSAS